MLPQRAAYFAMLFDRMPPSSSISPNTAIFLPAQAVLKVSSAASNRRRRGVVSIVNNKGVFNAAQQVHAPLRRLVGAEAGHDIAHVLAERHAHRRSRKRRQERVCSERAEHW